MEYSTHKTYDLLFHLSMPKHSYTHIHTHAHTHTNAHTHTHSRTHRHISIYTAHNFESTNIFF